MIKTIFSGITYVANICTKIITVASTVKAKAESFIKTKLIIIIKKTQAKVTDTKTYIREFERTLKTIEKRLRFPHDYKQSLLLLVVRLALLYLKIIISFLSFSSFLILGLIAYIIYTVGLFEPSSLFNTILLMMKGELHVHYNTTIK